MYHIPYTEINQLITTKKNKKEARFSTKKTVHARRTCFTPCAGTCKGQTMLIQPLLSNYGTWPHYKPPPCPPPLSHHVSIITLVCHSEKRGGGNIPHASLYSNQKLGIANNANLRDRTGIPVAFVAFRRIIFRSTRHRHASISCDGFTRFSWFRLQLWASW